MWPGRNEIAQLKSRRMPPVRITLQNERVPAAREANTDNVVTCVDAGVRVGLTPARPDDPGTRQRPQARPEASACKLSRVGGGPSTALSAAAVAVGVAVHSMNEHIAFVMQRPDQPVHAPEGGIHE